MTEKLESYKKMNKNKTNSIKTLANILYRYISNILQVVSIRITTLLKQKACIQVAIDEIKNKRSHNVSTLFIQFACKIQTDKIIFQKTHFKTWRIGWI